MLLIIKSSITNTVRDPEQAANTIHITKSYYTRCRDVPPVIPSGPYMHQDSLPNLKSSSEYRYRRR